MKIFALMITALLFNTCSALSQPEFYADPYIGYPEFRVLPRRLPLPAADSIRIEVHVRILYDDLQFVKVEDHYDAGYSLDVLLKKPDGTLLGSQHAERRLSVDSYAQTNSRRSGDQTAFEFTVIPSKYDLRIALLDHESRKDRVLEKTIEFPAKEWSPELRVSDLILLDSTKTPVLSSNILSGERLFAAFSIYSDKSGDLSVEYHLLNDEDDVISSRMLAVPSAPWFADTLEVDAQNLANGTYRVVFSAKAGNTRVARGYPFKVMWQNLPDFIHDLDQAIRELKYIASDEEMERFASASPSQREQLFRQFWKKRDPTPSTPENERMNEYYRRIAYANAHFSSFRDGWETDMGRVYVIFGAPTDVERHPFDIDKKPYEVWYYYDINRKFLFVDEDGFGQYRLKSSLWNEY
jgi:GWxTD domain-containing protein